MLTISAFESEFLNLRISRCDLDILNEDVIDKIRTSAIEQNIDVIRLKIPATTTNSQQYLSKLSFPFSFSGGISEFSVIREKYDFSNCRNNVELIEATANDEHKFKDYFYQTFSEHNIGYMNSPYLSTILTDKDELDCLFNFYLKYLTAKDHRVIFFKKDGIEIGFTTVQRTAENVLISPVTGVLPQFRSQGLLTEIFESYLLYFRDNKYDSSVLSARIENSIMIQFYFKLKFKFEGNRFNYNITPLLNKQNNKEKIVLKQVQFYDSETLISLIKNKIQSTENNTLQLKDCKSYIDKSFDKTISCDIEISQPYNNKFSALFVCKIIQNNKVTSIFWLEYEYC